MKDRRSDDAIDITVTRDQALVLSEWLARNSEPTPLSVESRPTFEHVAEVMALVGIETALEKQLTELFDPEYRRRVEEARSRMRWPGEA